jgi:hypothetical protein
MMLELWLVVPLFAGVMIATGFLRMYLQGWLK